MSKRESKIKIYFKKKFSKWFGFEEGIDIADDVAVLHRRNVVIKNIIFVSNLIYSGLLFALSLSGAGEKSDWFYTAMSFPVTYLINKLLRYLINLDTRDKTKQSIASYMAVGYMFFSSLLIYGRFYNNPTFEAAAYVLLFYAIVVISLYQDKKLLSSVFAGVLVTMTIIHFLWTYQISAMAEGKTIGEFLPLFIHDDAFKGILLRTFVFAEFYLVVYAIVAIGQYMQEERKKELMRRREVQGDFSNIVKDLFSAILVDGGMISSNPNYAYQMKMLTRFIAKLCAMNQADMDALESFSIIHLKFDEIKKIASNQEDFTENGYDTLRDQTTLGAEIVKRIQLAKKADTIIRSYVEQSIKAPMVKELKSIQPERGSQIIVMAEVYLKFRESTPYKRPYTHTKFVSELQGQIGQFFDQDLKERVSLFHADLDELYNNFMDVSLDNSSKIE